jgi:hypothetical protein
MDFDEIRKSVLPSQQSILEAVDEYTLYCFYMGTDELILGKVYPAPYRQDPIPSFSVFRTTFDIGYDFWWKDHGKDEKGNIFKLIQKIANLESLTQVFQRINEDFGLNYDLPNLGKTEKVNLYGTPKESDIKIRIHEIPFTTRGLKYWEQFSIGPLLLKEFNTCMIDCYWSYADQEAPFTVPDPTFAYRTGKYYQIYSPFAEKIYKFRNDLPENYFFGYLQLPPTGEKLIIDKSSKDVIFCRRLGYSAVSGKSETTMIPHQKVLELLSRFKDVYIMLDNDQAGMRQTEKYMHLYPSLKPRFIDPALAKDKTDLCKAVGFNQAEQIIKELIQ